MRPYFKDPEHRKEKNYVEPEHLKTIEEFNDGRQNGPCVNLKIAIFGLRNLIKKAINPIITVRLTHGLPADQSEFVIQYA
jgi:hypothetical protein